MVTGARPGRVFRACPAARLFLAPGGFHPSVEVLSKDESVPPNSSSAGSLGRTIVAILVLLVVGYFLLHVLIGVAVAIAGFAVVILAVVAVIWALRVLL